MRSRKPLAIAACVAACAALSPAPGPAVGPELPIQIEVIEGIVQVLVDETLIEDIRAERLIYRNGELLERFSLEPRFEPREAKKAQSLKRYRKEPCCEEGEPARWTAARYELAELAKELRDLEPGPYAVKLVVTGIWKIQPGAQLREERWLRFAADGEKLRPLTLREYSDRVEKPELAVDDEGRKVLVFVGGGPEEEIDARKTKGEVDRPLGRLGGLEPERAEQESERRAQERDESEKDEN